MPPRLSRGGSLGTADVFVVLFLQGDVVRAHIHSSPANVGCPFLQGTNDSIAFLIPGAPLIWDQVSLRLSKAIGLGLPSSPTCYSTAPTTNLLAGYPYEKS